MIYRIASDIVVIVHLLFILFVIFGGFISIKKHWVMFIHLPCAVWAVLLEFRGWICPLTPLENYLMQAGGEAGYSGGFIDHYLLPVIYPDFLTVKLQIIFGSFVILINLFIYGFMTYHYFRNKYFSCG